MTGVSGAYNRRFGGTGASKTGQGSKDNHMPQGANRAVPPGREEDGTEAVSDRCSDRPPLPQGVATEQLNIGIRGNILLV